MKRIVAVLSLLLAIAGSVAAQSGRQQQARPRVIPQSSPTPIPNQDPAIIAPKPVETPTTTTTTNAPVKENPVVVADDDEVLRVETNLVTIPVSVFDRSGRYLPDLKQTDFKVFEEGKEQEIAYFGSSEQPVTVVLVLDTSPSTELRIEQIQDAAISFVNQLKPNDKVMVIEFDANVHVLSEFTNDKYRLAKAIRKADFGDGTSIYDTVENVIYKRLSKVEGRKAIVMFTDGVDTTSSRADAYSSLKAAEESSAPFYVVYYDTYSENRAAAGGGGGVMSSPYPPIFGSPFPFPGGGGGYPQRSARGTSMRDYEEGRRYLDELTEKSGGRIFSTETNRSLEDAFSGIAEELRRQYNIGYYPTEPGQKGQRKQIKVRINRPNAVVKSRDSYIVGESIQHQAASNNSAPKKQ